MADVSKIVRARMAKVPVAGPHPDAGLLTAFAERSLAGAEREGVLSHLATCADCREVVALAAPEATGELEVVAPHRTKPRWLTMPVMQWGAVAAAVAVVAVAVVMQSPRMQQPATFHAKKSLAVASADKPAQEQTPAVGSAGKASERERDTAAIARVQNKVQNEDLRAAEAKNNQAEVRTKEGRLDDLAMKRDELAKQKKEDGDRALAMATPSAAAPPPPAPVMSARRPDAGNVARNGVSENGSGVVTSRKVGEEGRPAGGASAGMVAQAERNEPASEVGSLESGHKDSKLARQPAPQQVPTKPAAPAAAYDSVVSVNGASLSAKVAPSPEPAQRAKSSEATTPAAMSPGVYGPGYAGESTARSGPAAELRLQSRPFTLRWTVTSDGRVQRSLDGGHSWTDVTIVRDKTVKFRALATDGNEIWAGGTRGALYYSADAGNTWRVHPLGLTSDIVRLSVSGKSLVVSTSSGQTIQVSHEAFADTAAKPPSDR